MRLRARFVPRPDGTIELRLPEGERRLLASLPAQLREMLRDDADTNPSLGRLFPPAYLRDEEHDAEFHRLMREDLLARKIEVAEIVEQSAHAESLDEAQLYAWMAALNDLRLVIGTQIDVSEDLDVSDLDEEDPRFHAYVLYSHLSMLLGEIVDVLADRLPDPPEP